MTTDAASQPTHTTSHPLDNIALFRRWPCSPLRDIVYTGIWNALMAVAIAASGMDGRSFLERLPPVLVVANVVGYLIHATLVLADRQLGGWPRRARGAARAAYYVGLVGLCVLVGVILGNALLNATNPLSYVTRAAELTPLLPFAVVMAVFTFAVLANGERSIASDILAARQNAQIASAAQLLAEARLRALQSQIEPHFLYNTLANVVSLIDTQPTQARRMLERFIDYLRASLAASRAESATLGAELDLAAAYLDVLSVRMGPRLRYRFDIAPGCRELAIAPMLLQPLVENAVAHGLDPKVEGGEIVVRAESRAGCLCIEISDTGVGPGTAPTKPGGGVGLSNLRARLRSLYAGEAQVQLLENQPCGVTVRLVLPLKETLPSNRPAP